jgi:hypothetical protein
MVVLRTSSDVHCGPHDKIWPHAHATRGNVPVTLEVIGK